jgi:hypothetical protein
MAGAGEGWHEGRLMVRGLIATIGELFRFMWGRRLWWLIPMVAVLLVFGVLIALGTVAGVGPFIYTLF